MKLLHVHDYFAPGNSRFGFDMDRHLADRGHSVHVLSTVGDRGPADGATVDGVVFHTFPRRKDLGGWKRYSFMVGSFRRRFESLHREHAYDLVVLNQPICARGVLSAPAVDSIPKVYWFLSPWAGEWRADHPGAGFLSRWFNEGARDRLERYAVRRCDAVLVESEFIGRQLCAHHGDLAGGRTTLVPGAVDLRTFHPNGAPASHRERFGLGSGPVILTVRRLVRRMGIDRLIEAASKVPGATLVVGGDGPLRGELEAQAKSLDVKAVFLGYVPDGDLPSLYRAADLFVLPTRALEGFGLVAIEAMACGTPAMGTPVGAIPEVLGPLGLVFEDQSPESMAAAMRKFFDDRDPGLPERCRRHVEERYDWGKVAADVESLFLGMTREGSGHRRG